MYSAYSGQCDAAALLIERGAKVDERAVGGDTALANAIRCENEDMARLLRQHGASE
jgi:ankyrin repeat protein